MLRILMAILLTTASSISLGADFSLPTPLLPSEGPAREEQGVSSATFKQLEKAYLLMTEQDYVSALDLLNTLATKVKSSYEQAVVIKTAGYLYLEMENQPKVIELFTLLIELNTLTVSETHQLRFNLALLNLSQQDYARASELLERWFESEADPKPRDYIYLAQAYQLQDRAGEAIDQYKLAIASATTPHDSWYQQLLGLYYQQERYSESILLLKQLIQTHPNTVKYWEQLAALYEWQALPDQALAVWELAHKNGLLDTDSQIIRLSNLLLQQGYPLKSALILEVAATGKLIESNAENLAKQALAWQLAQEYEKASELYEQASLLAPMEDYRLQLASMHLQNRNWQAALSALKGVPPVNQDGDYFTLVGYLNYELKKYSESQRAYEQGLGFESSIEEAKNWLTYLSSLKNAQEQKLSE